MLVGAFTSMYGKQRERFVVTGFMLLLQLEFPLVWSGMEVLMYSPADYAVADYILMD